MMTDREFTIEFRRGIIILLRACIRRFGLSWDWFRPEAEAVYVRPAGNTTTTS